MACLFTNTLQVEDRMVLVRMADQMDHWEAWVEEGRMEGEASREPLEAGVAQGVWVDEELVWVEEWVLWEVL